MPEQPGQPGQPGQPEQPGQAPGRMPDRVRMPLLALVNAEALDQDYVLAARRRSRPVSGTARDEDPTSPPPPGGPVRASRTATAVTVASVAVFGVLLATASVQNRQDADTRDAGRAGLIDRIESERARVGADQDRVAGLRTRTADAEVQATELSQDLSVETSRLQRLQTTTGFVAVRGEGVRASLDQAPDAGPSSVLRDSDLALLVNALWSAGAEAVAVNGQRLTALSAIRTSGVAVEINGVGIAPPFTVQAVGDRATLQAEFYETSSGLAFADLAARYSFDFELENATDLSLPAAPGRLLRLRSASTGTGAPGEPDGSTS